MCKHAHMFHIIFCMDHQLCVSELPQLGSDDNIGTGSPISSELPAVILPVELI